ncbi:MAG: hypothetical protein V8S95_10540 [Odoribacter sp.]
MVLPLAGAYDASNHILTIIEFSIPDQPKVYVKLNVGISTGTFPGRCYECL